MLKIGLQGLGRILIFLETFFKKASLVVQSPVGNGRLIRTAVNLGVARLMTKCSESFAFVVPVTQFCYTFESSSSPF